MASANLNLNTSTKATMIDEVHSFGKNAVLTAETFSQKQTGLSSTVEAHTDAIDMLSVNYKHLEAQVQSISRVIASQNVQKLQETMKLAQEETRRSLIHLFSEKQKDTMARVERELLEIGDAKGNLVKRIDAVESNILSTVTAKFEDAYAMRRENRDEIEKMKEAMGEVPAIAEKNSKLLKSLDIRVVELREDFRAMERATETANIEQDKTTATLVSEVRTALEAAKDKITEETKSMQRSMQKREVLLSEEVRNVKEMIEKEGTLRGNAIKHTENFVKEEIFKLKTDSDRKISMVEAGVKHVMTPFEGSIRELKHLVEEESVHRDTADKELARRIAKENGDRHHDEERLVALISTCQAAVAKMHK